MTNVPGIDVWCEQYSPIVAVGWFGEHTDNVVHPHVAGESDYWWAFDAGNPVALALVEVYEAKTPKLHRIGVTEFRRREGIATMLVAELLPEYGVLTADCRRSNDANQFFQSTGWERTGARQGVPEDFVEYRIEHELPET